jgi:FtsP/CotA-like multicopper oxidase with cupredoxin domain
VTSARNRCDTLLAPDGSQLYPGKNKDGTERDKFPNCFHASSTSNLHFHGTHVSPGGFEDNVLVGVINNPYIDPRVAIQEAIDAYGTWAGGGDPTADLIETAQASLRVMLTRARADNNTELVEQINEAIHTNHMLMEHQEWPQYWPGLYPHRFTLPVWAPGGQYKMGQSPGTHWYHCHQHGSTTVQILNGMAGVVIITGDYDDKMLRIGGGTPEKPKIKEQVLMFQLFSEQPNLLLPAGSPTVGTMACNGQVLPTVTMKKGEVQWWRIANAAMRSHGVDQFVFVTKSAYDAYVKNPASMLTGTPPDNAPPPTSPAGTIPIMNQTAQDGVQFQWKTYQAMSNLPFVPLSPGNRADFLVKAPETEGTMYLVFWPPAGGPAKIRDIRANTVFKLVVAGNPDGEATEFPTEKEFPEQPKFLTDITEAELSGRRRTITFSMDGGPGGAPNQPIFRIDGEQFNEGEIDQVMLLGNAEEWTILNTSLVGVMHPFHIHINPFQLVEIYNPFTMTAPEKLPTPWIWWDTLAIPAGVQKTRTGADGKPETYVDPGMIKIRSRFVDFPGKYVLHCHILGHEDRGMMQLVEVVDRKTVVKHH